MIQLICLIQLIILHSDSNFSLLEDLVEACEMVEIPSTILIF